MTSHDKPSMPSTPSPFNIGVLFIPPTQLLDLSPIDLFGMLTPAYLKACNLPAPLLALGHPVNIHYISSSHSSPNSSVELTASASLITTSSLTTPTVQPSHLHALLIPGPDPSLIPSEAEKSFIRAHAAGGTDILTVCTGIFPAGYSGVLDGKSVTGPRALISQLRSKFPKAKWVEKRWVRDAGGKVWTSGGITNGQDMVSAYLHEKFPRELADLVCRMAEVGDRGQEYGSGKAGETGWWVWLILRSWWKGSGKSKSM